VLFSLIPPALGLLTSEEPEIDIAVAGFASSYRAFPRSLIGSDSGEAPYWTISTLSSGKYARFPVARRLSSTCSSPGPLLKNAGAIIVLFARMGTGCQ
jgi:hypothetical protein